MSYTPAFNRYPPAVLQGIGRIERARGEIEASAILPAQEEILRRDALVGSIHYSNVIEGNELGRLEAVRALDHDLPADDKAKLELVNYVAALAFIDERHRRGQIEYSSDFLKQLHGVLTKGLGREDAMFKPHHEGDWRDGVVAVGDAIAMFHVAPDPGDVPDLMEARLDWLERRREDPDFPVPILAGVAHFEVTEVHPFADYNGRVARLFATAILRREGLLSRPLFSPERYYAEDKDAYHTALRAIRETRHLDEWLTYYVDGLAAEFERVATKVRDLNALTRKLPIPLELTRGQEQAIAALTAEGRRDLTIAEYAELADVSTRTASRELNALTKAGVLRAIGSTRDRRFTLIVAGSATGGRPRTWTEERITSELTELIRKIGHRPSYRDFEAAGDLPLYAAIRRTGGLDRWLKELGI